MRTRFAFYLAIVLLTICRGCGKAYAVPPSTPPVIGLTLRMDFVRARDGDTIEARIHGSAFVFAFRLIETWAPELHDLDPHLRSVAANARDFATERCKASEHLVVYIPLASMDQPLKALTFDRVPAWVYLDQQPITLNEQVVHAGYASSTKAGKLGE